MARLQTVRVAIWLAFVVLVLVITGLGQNFRPAEQLDPLVSGNPNAKIKFEVFYDLQCPTCASFHSILNMVERKFPGKTFMTFRHFPLGIPAHDKAIMAARVVEAAHRQGKGRKMLDVILANQRVWTSTKRAKTILFGYAVKLRLEMRQFREDFESDEVIRRVVHDMELARFLELGATPTVFLNGKELSPVEFLELETVVRNIVDKR